MLSSQILGWSWVISVIEPPCNCLGHNSYLPMYWGQHQWFTCQTIVLSHTCDDLNNIHPTNEHGLPHYDVEWHKWTRVGLSTLFFWKNSPRDCAWLSVIGPYETACGKKTRVIQRDSAWFSVIGFFCFFWRFPRPTLNPLDLYDSNILTKLGWGTSWGGPAWLEQRPKLWVRPEHGEGL